MGQHFAEGLTDADGKPLNGRTQKDLNTYIAALYYDKTGAADGNHNALVKELLGDYIYDASLLNARSVSRSTCRAGRSTRSFTIPNPISSASIRTVLRIFMTAAMTTAAMTACRLLLCRGPRQRCAAGADEAEGQESPPDERRDADPELERQLQPRRSGHLLHSHGLRRGTPATIGSRCLPSRSSATPRVRRMITSRSSPRCLLRFIRIMMRANRRKPRKNSTSR